MAKTKPQEIWNEFEEIKSYMTSQNLYSTVETNEKFYEGKQWEGLSENSTMPKPVFNVLQRAGKFMVATIGSNDIAITMTPFTEIADEIERIVPISKEIENIIEIARIKEQSKIIIRNAFVDGAGYLLLSFDPSVETGQPVKGIVKSQVIDNTNMYFGNPYSNDVQSQPYIIVALRQHISQVRKEAKRLGISKEDIEQIKPDNQTDQVNDDSSKLVTVLLKFYKEYKKEDNVKQEIDKYTGEINEIHDIREYETVWFTKTTCNVTLIKPTDLGYRRYPISCFGWDLIKNSFLYTSPMTANIMNQIFINKSFAIAQMYGLQSAFPKIIFDKSKVDMDDFLNSVSPYAVSGIDMMGKFLDFIKIPDFSNNIIELGKETISQTKDCMGVTDASLGNVNPDNTSAIIALQESSNVPLEIQKQGFFEFWEDTVRNIIDIIANNYGVRQIMTEDNKLATVDFSILKDINFNLKVEIGTGAQFSEIAQVNTLDKLVQAGFIPPDAYMKAVPSKYIPQKQSLLNAYYQMVSQGQVPESRGSTELDENTPL